MHDVDVCLVIIFHLIQNQLVTMGLCIVKHKVKKQIMAIHLEKKSLGNYDTEDSRTKEKCLCFEVCALCLCSTMESSKLYMW